MTRINEKTTYFPVFKLRMAGWLMMQGLPCQHMDVNYLYPHWMVYYFENTPELKAAIKKYEKRWVVRNGKHKK